jgi:hypothetical protein
MWRFVFGVQLSNAGVLGVDFCLIWCCQVLEHDPGAGFDVFGAQIVYPQTNFGFILNLGVD